MNIVDEIRQGKTSVGIELGSTRIKAVLIGSDFSPAVSGVYDWENKYENNVWTYSAEDIENGVHGCFSDLSENVKKQYGIPLESAACVGISAMMHGYLAFDENDELLVPFRTWRNTITQEASDKLTEAFGFNIPQRWSVSHLYQAILNNEPHVKNIRFITTLAGYVHWKLTGEKVIGIGDASGMFPIDPNTMDYNADMLGKFDKLSGERGFTQKLSDILPKIVSVGECAGKLTNEGAALLDKSGVFKAGVCFCPPEGDAQTGMVATNSIAQKTGNVSAGTSIFAMVVLERELKEAYRQIDIVTTPCGSPVAMVHCNNCSTDLDAWVNLFRENLALFGAEVKKSELYDRLYDAALSGESDCGGIVTCNYYSGEHVTGFTEGKPMLLRSPTADFNIPNLMRSLVYSAMTTLKIGMDILTKQEKITLDKIYAHGGLFKSPAASQRFLSAALGVLVELMKSAGEGGSWGIAVLASYCADKKDGETLPDYLNGRVFAGMSGDIVCPDVKDSVGFEEYTQAFKKALKVEEIAVLQK